MRLLKMNGQAWGGWKSASRDVVGRFSALCWSFGAELAIWRRRSCDTGGSSCGDAAVSIGLIDVSMVALNMRSLVTAESERSCYNVGVEEHQKRTGAYFEQQIQPLAPMSLAGFVWWQGESDVGHADAYECLFPALVQQLRREFGGCGGAAEQPFFAFVRIARYCAHGTSAASVPALRQAQMAALSLSRVAFVPSEDLGQGCALHPRTKRTLGKRLALAAAAIVDNDKSAQWRAPSMERVLAADDGALVHCRDVVGSLVLRPRARRGCAAACDARYTVMDSLGRSTCMSVCRDAALHDGKSWRSASVTIRGRASFALRFANHRRGLHARGQGAAATPTAASYGWSAVPALSVVDNATGLPVLPWRVGTLVASRRDANMVPLS